VLSYNLNIKHFVIKFFFINLFLLFTATRLVAADEYNPFRKPSLSGEVQVVRQQYSASSDRLFEFSLGAGYRNDSLSWSEAGGSVNILSELKWQNLRITQINAAVNFYFSGDWLLKSMLDYGRVNSGTNQDSDYNGNNRTLEFSRSNNKGGGEVKDASLGLGNTIRILNNIGNSELSITPLIGVSIHEQYLTMTDGFQTLPASGPFPGLNSSYDAQWLGFWAGIETVLNITRDWLITGSLAIHRADYSAQANWNLRPEFSHPVSFTHTAKGGGSSLEVGAIYVARKDWRANISLAMQRWRAGGGMDRTNLSDGSSGYFPLNEVTWESTVLNLGISYFF